MRTLPLLAALAALALAPAAQALPVVYVATLDGASESPPVVTPGTGTSRLTIDLATDFLRIEASFSGLTGTTTVAHVHAPTADPFLGTAGVAVTPGTLTGFPVGVTSGTYDMTFDLGDTAIYTVGFLTLGGGTAEGAAALLAASLAEGRAYLNIHTSFVGSGEIRGFYTPAPVPLPPALGIMALAVAGLAAAARRRG